MNPIFFCRASFLFAVLVSGAVSAATFAVVVKDDAGLGLNDTTAFTAVGGNNATTLGQARLNVINEAGRIWGGQLTSTQTIVIDAKFAAQTCTTSSGTLASAGPLTYFTGGSLPIANVLYPAALADALSSSNVNNRDDINMTINSNVGSGSGCLGGRSFYLGFDHQNGGSIDLLNTLLHEIGHGLGFVSLTDQNGASAASNGQLSIFDQSIYYETLGKFWPALTNVERASASVSNGALVWSGPAVNGQAARVASGLSKQCHLRLYAPAAWDDGSSVSHWDKYPIVSPALLMQPFLSANPNGTTDLTGCVLRDIGWLGTVCPDGTSAAVSLPTATPQSVAVLQDTPTQITFCGTNADSMGLLTYQIKSQPANGTLVSISGLSGSTGATFIYTPNSKYVGSDSLTFSVSDSLGASPAAQVFITVTAVNHAPVATAQTLTATTGVALGVTLSAVDSDGDALRYSLQSSPASGTLSGTVPNLTYTSNAAFTGTDSFTFQANDGSLNSSIASVTIVVAAPQVAVSTGTNGGGGGGAIDWTELALLTSLVALRLRRSGFGARRSITPNS